MIRIYVEKLQQISILEVTSNIGQFYNKIFCLLHDSRSLSKDSDSIPSHWRAFG